MVLVAGVLGCSVERQPLERPRPEAETVPFVDAHVHLNDESMQLEMMRRSGATRAVVFWGRNSDNESIADSAKRHPDLFIAFASISPERAAYRRAWDAQDTTLLGTLDDLLASGRFRGIGGSPPPTSLRRVSPRPTTIRWGR